MNPDSALSAAASPAGATARQGPGPLAAPLRARVRSWGGRVCADRCRGDRRIVRPTCRVGFPWLPTLVPGIKALGSWPPGTWPGGLRATRQEDVISMRALVVYESMYGNTQVTASNIADGLRGDYEVIWYRWPRPPLSWSPEPICWWPALRPTCTGCRARRPGGWPRRRPPRRAAGCGWTRAPAARGCGTGSRTSAARTAWPPPSTPGSTASPRSPAGPAAHRQAAEAARPPARRGPGELPGQLAEHAARRRGRAGPPLGDVARRGEQDLLARARLRIARRGESDG